MRGSRVGLLMAALAMSSAMAPAIPAFEIRKRDDMEPWERNGKPDTVNTGRRAEKDAAALAKAEAKRARKAAKRAADASYNAGGNATERSEGRVDHNVGRHTEE